MGAQLLGYHIIRRTDGKKVMYIGVVPLKKKAKEAKRVYPTSKYFWVESRDISAPKSSMYKCR